MFNRQEIKVVQDLLRSQKLSTRRNKTWERVVSGWGIGRFVDKEFKITPAEQVSLRAIFKRETGLDPLAGDLSGTRMDLARQGADEKLSAQSVFAELAQVARARESVPMKQGPAVTPRGTLLSVNLEDIDPVGLGQVIVVENGWAIRDWSRIQLATGAAAAPLFVYRGHGGSARLLNSWLNQLPREVQRTGFFDWDPAGVCMGVNSALFDSLLVPSAGALEGLQKHSKLRSFLDQEIIAEAQIARLDGVARRLLRDVLDGQWALTQESMIEMGVELELVDLN